MLPQIPESAAKYGFVIEGLGTHSSRTMMLSELRLLLVACPMKTKRDDYRSAIRDDNVLLKETQSTRNKSFRHLRELYGLDPDICLFQSLRALWEQQKEAQPMLALLCALSRDPSLRETAGVVLDLPYGSALSSDMLADAAERAFPGLSKETTLAKIGRNAASSWTQAGHLVGRTNKQRVRAEVYSTSLTYALLLGHLCGARGEALFSTFWARVLDQPDDVLHEQAAIASRQGWLEYRHMGAVTEITFDYLLEDDHLDDESKVQVP